LPNPKPRTFVLVIAEVAVLVPKRDQPVSDLSGIGIDGSSILTEALSYLGFIEDRSFILKERKSQMGRLIVTAGILLIIVGLIVLGAERLGIRLGRLPGDIRIEGRRGGFYFPIATCLVLSAVLSAIAWLFRSR
jgi:hypothetical protein